MSIVLEQLTKRYDGYPVVNNVSLEVKDGEFFVLLGSSGSGKSTILNLIAGLTSADHGQIILHNRNVTHLPTQKRRVGFVFQNYALFQYMTVAENVEFGLTIQKVASLERQKRRDEALELVGLAGLGNRMPRQLSGGQQQRVALARALVYGPDVLLLDEPLGALDAKIRIDLRRNLRSIQRQLGITTIFVTHDQEEAFDLADRIGVMSFGRLIEVEHSPEELYQRPQTEFVASFLGTANLLVGNITAQSVELGPIRLPIPPEIQHAGSERRVQVLFRPEDVALAPTPAELNCPELGRGEVEETSFGGAQERLRLRLAPIAGVRPIAPLPGFGSANILVDATRSPEQASRFPLQLGEAAWVGVPVPCPGASGFELLIVTDGSLRAQAALALGGQIARLAHARVTLLGVGPNGQAMENHLQEARKQLGSGLAALEVQTSNSPIAAAVATATEQAPYDLVIIGLSLQENLALAEQVLQAGDFHLLLVPSPQPAPTQTLICATSGEPGKEDVLFAGRLVRHLGAEATLLCVLPVAAKTPGRLEQTQRFLDGGVQSLSILGVPAKTIIRNGSATPEILDEVKNKGYDLLVMGAPLARQSSEIKLDGVVGEVLTSLTDKAVLIVRSHLIQSKNPLTQPKALAK